MNVYLATWTEEYDMFEKVTHTYLIIANDKEEAIRKIRDAKHVTDSLKVTEYPHKDGIIFVSAF